MPRPITLTEVDEIAVITLSNDAEANAIDLAFCEGLLNALETIQTSAKHRVAVIRATGRIFSAGGNLAQILAGLERSDTFLATLIGELHAAILAIRRLPIPVIASVQGAAAGAGFSLAMACDFAVASTSARFVVGYGALGTSSDGGLSWHLTRRLGPAQALELMLARGALSADEAAALRLVQALAEPHALEEETLAMARKVAALPPAAVREMKQLVGLAAGDGLEQHLENEKQAFLRCASTSEFARRVAAFVGRSDRPVSSPSA
ncbi:enoyl-CoA hydratase/isomerase family protein [Paraburkholderia pallida]|uniref:Enoyl-CoA hydratase/isomerase family protein n=1 Tax=Paraburkholderia pallida TaxID=2547399 RepID=A0A4P7D9J2_9BURK|nr:enoyl-CoA hydratase/isomerase family protein [Paraburkholderia pallida]QBR03514.1 enoyl-CoA hydratase/isomerase family protein [Paraburkholderia pallida]